MKAEGFSFIEVMAAMVILSISLVVLLGSQGRSMELVGRAQTLHYATTLATSKMAELTQEATTKGVGTLRESEAGEFDQEKHPGFRWRYRIVKVPSPDFAGMMAGAVGGEEEDLGAAEGSAALLAGPLQAIGKIWGESLRELHVEVLWGEERTSQSLELVTHLIAPEAMAQVQGLVGAVSGPTTGGRR